MIFLFLFLKIIETDTFYLLFPSKKKKKKLEMINAAFFS